MHSTLTTLFLFIHTLYSLILSSFSSSLLFSFSPFLLSSFSTSLPILSEMRALDNELRTAVKAQNRIFSALDAQHTRLSDSDYYDTPDVLDVLQGGGDEVISSNPSSSTSSPTSPSTSRSVVGGAVTLPGIYMQCMDDRNWRIRAHTQSNGLIYTSPSLSLSLTYFCVHIVVFLLFVHCIYMCVYCGCISVTCILHSSV